MATLRLFAQAREAAGTKSAKLEGDTVAEVLEAATALFGSDFESVLGGSRVWLNGEQAESSDRVSADDEVAVLPPVSGG